MTPEGSIALQIASAPGAQRYAGMAGAFTGLDYAAALAIAPPKCARDALAALLLQAEAGYLAGVSKNAGNQDGS